MNILLISLNYPPDDTGGASIYAQELCNLLSENKENTIYVITSGKETGVVNEGENVQIYRYKCIFKPIIMLLSFVFQVNKNIKKFIKIHNIDYVHFTDVDTNLFVNKIPFTLTVHHLVIHNFKNSNLINNIRSVFYLLMEKRSIRKASQIIAVSEATKFELLDLYKEAKDKTQTVSPLIDFEKYKRNKKTNLKSDLNLTAETIVFLCPGLAREERKGGLYFIQALCKIKRKDNLLFLITGGSRLGGWKQRMLNEIKSNGLNDIVKFVGEVKDDVLVEYYLNSDVILFPSIFEGYGLPVLEAMAASKPIIATKTGEAQYFIDNMENGIIINSANSEELYEAIRLIIKNPQLRIDLGEKARLGLNSKMNRSESREKMESLYKKSKNIFR